MTTFQSRFPDSPSDDELSMSRGFADLDLNHPAAHMDPAQYYQQPPPPPPPPPLISSEGIVAFDITREFRDAAAALEPGELVKDGYFTLFESVGALEIMDPKMDSGCLAPGESLDEEYDVTRPLEPNEVLGVIDQLLCLEMAWHLGYPLSQTVFTSVYIDKILDPAPTTLEQADFFRDRPGEQQLMHRVLRAYCLGLIKTCWLVNERIKSEHYYEEEDFVTNTYNRPLLDTIPSSVIHTELLSAREALLHSLSAIGPDLTNALVSRLDMRLNFLYAVELMEQRSADPEVLRQPWVKLQEIWKEVGRTQGMGKRVAEAFSTKIQRRLASTMPPRPIVQLGGEEMVRLFGQLWEDGERVVGVLGWRDAQSLLNFILTYHSPLLFPRTLLQYFLFHDMVILGRLSIRQLLDDDLSTLVLPSSPLLDRANDAVEHPHHPRYQLAQTMELFRQRVAQSYLDVFRTWCQNRCRVRRTMVHAIADWEAVQAEAEEFDGRLMGVLLEQAVKYPPMSGEEGHAMPLSSWAYHYKLRLMQWTVLLGFELEIYQAAELPGMYWYLAYLADHHVRHLSGTQSSVDRQLTANPPLTPTQQKLAARCKSFLRLALLEASATYALADSLSCLWTAIERMGLLPDIKRKQNFPYGGDELRYELRMRPWASVSLPALPTYEEFVESVKRADVSTAELLEMAVRGAKRAEKGLETLAGWGTFSGAQDGGKGGGKESYEWGPFCLPGWGTESWRENVRKWMSAAVAAGTVVEGLKGVGNGEDKEWVKVEVPKVEERYHSWWVVPGLSKEGERGQVV